MPGQGSLVVVSVPLELQHHSGDQPWAPLSQPKTADLWPKTPWKAVSVSACSIGWGQYGSAAARRDWDHIFVSARLCDSLWSRQHPEGEYAASGDNREYVTEPGLNTHLLNAVPKVQSLDTWEYVGAPINLPSAFTVKWLTLRTSLRSWAWG